MTSDPDETAFWALAAPLLERGGVSRSTMMGYPCLRLDGDFFASLDPRAGRLIVKLDATTVAGLIERGEAEPFAPSGRPFREWAAVPASRGSTWSDLLDRALLAALARRR